MSDARSITVQIDNITEAQEIALRDMFATWMSLGSMGSSRWTAFYADGDGNFHPHIKVNDERPALTDLVTRDERWRVCDRPQSQMYWIDFDMIAWRLRAQNETPK